MRAVPPSTRAQTTQHAAPGSSSQHAGPQDPQQDQERERGQDAGSASGPTGTSVEPERRPGAPPASTSLQLHAHAGYRRFNADHSFYQSEPVSAV